VLHVSNTGTPPQLFGPRIPVVVIGHFTTNTSFNFVSNGILVKHSPDYVAKYPGRVTAPNGSVR
jgi:cytochrome c-type biogenesis protein CcmE